MRQHHARDHDTWDLFLAWPIDDSYLDSIRQECLRICRECPPVRGKDINHEGEKRVAALLAEPRCSVGIAMKSIIGDRLYLGQSIGHASVARDPPALLRWTMRESTECWVSLLG